VFDSRSRYAGLAVRTLLVRGPEGEPREVPYVERRFVPPLAEGAAVVEHAVVQGDRLDNITAKYLGDPTQFWRVCDANEVLDPNELTDAVGRRIRIPLPGM
jgi:hypothetical protein